MQKTRLFFLSTLLFSWTLWVPVALFVTDPALGMPLVLLGAFGPSIVGVWLTRRNEGSEGLRELWRRLLQPGRIPAPWLLLIVVLFPAMAALGYVVDLGFGGTPPALDLSVFANPVSALGFIALMILGGPLAEELGWRGYALDPMQRERSALVASIALGGVWAAWHLPLFMIPGTSQAALGIGTARFWMWTLEVISVSVIYTWVYNHTRRSVLAAVLLHLFDNTTYTLFVPIGDMAPMQTEVISTALYVAVAVIAIAHGGASRLGARISPGSLAERCAIGHRFRRTHSLRDEDGGFR
jgi:CAAX protease family protein